MDYNPISGFLDKFKKILFQKEEIKSIVIRVVSESISHPVGGESIKIKEGFIFIQGSPIIKSEIMMHKKTILLKIKELIPNINFLDIK